MKYAIDIDKIICNVVVYGIPDEQQKMQIKAEIETMLQEIANAPKSQTPETY